MRLLIRVTMVASLITADAAQAASLTATQGGRGAESQATNYEARFQNILDRDERNWKRLSASICTGCGSPPPPLEIARAAPLTGHAPRSTAAATLGTETTGTTSVSKPNPIRNVALQEHGEERARGVQARPHATRLTVRTRRYARYARLRILRHHRHLALLQARKRRHALLALRARHHAHRVRLATLGFGPAERGEAHSGGEPRPVPLPPERPDLLCADDRGTGAAGDHTSSACISSQ